MSELGLEAKTRLADHNWGTASLMVALDGCHLELLAIDGDPPSASPTAALVRKTLSEGRKLAAYCLRSRDMEGLRGELLEIGVDAGEVMSKGTVISAGQVLNRPMLGLTWSLAHPWFPFFVGCTDAAASANSAQAGEGRPLWRLAMVTVGSTDLKGSAAALQSITAESDLQLQVERHPCEAVVRIRLERGSDSLELD